MPSKNSNILKEVKKSITVALLLLFHFALFAGSMSSTVGSGYAYPEKLESIKENAFKYLKPGEVIMMDGPFFVGGKDYYVVDFLTKAEIKASLVYDTSSNKFLGDGSEGEIMRKVFATKDLKRLTTFEPLFYAVGDGEKLVVGSKYETQHVRNFASFASLTKEERDALNLYLLDYEELMHDVASVSKKTSEILYPENELKIAYIDSPPSLSMETNNYTKGRFSYEGFEELIKEYNELHRDYKKLVQDLRLFSGELEDYPPGTTIREKWGIKITKESILSGVDLIDANGDMMKEEIDVRKNILNWSYQKEIEEAGKRLGKKESSSGILSSISSSIKNILKRISTFFAAALGIASPAYSQEATGIANIPTMDELIDKKITKADEVKYKIEAEGIDDGVVKAIIYGYPLLLKGESVLVKGPYYYYGEPNYLIYILKDDVPTGYGFLVSATDYTLVGSQRKAFQVIKTLMIAEVIKKKPIYSKFSDADIEAIKKSSQEAPIPVDSFLLNLSLNMAEGKKLEAELINRADFSTLFSLTRKYREAFAMLSNIERLLPDSEARNQTKGFYDSIPELDAYFRAIQGLSADEFMRGRMAQYRTRTLNRMPLIQTMVAMGLKPSKAQVTNDLTSDLIYDNIYLYRLGAPRDPAIFARLAYKEGTYVLPETVPKELIDKSLLNQSNQSLR